MKKCSSLLLGILLGLSTVYPVLVIAGWFCGFSVELTFGNFSYLLSTVLFSSVSILLLAAKEKVHTKAERVLSTLLLPFSAAHAFVYLWESKSFWVFLLALVWVIFSGALMLRHGKYGFAQGFATAACLLLVLPMGFLSLFFLFPIGQNSVVQTLPSPSGTYYAEVIDSDQGALGGDTIVEVHEAKKRVNLLLLELRKDPQLVYLGQWGEFMDMQIFWQSEQELVIDGRLYELEED